MKAIAIDDEPIALEVVKAHAAKVPFIELVAVFTDAFQALEYLQKEPVDLIFLDIKMPVMDGFEFLDEYETMKQNLSHIPAIMMLTSSASFYDLERLKNYPDVLRHYSKPLSETDVRDLLQEYFPN